MGVCIKLNNTLLTDAMLYRGVQVGGGGTAGTGEEDGVGADLIFLTDKHRASVSNTGALAVPESRGCWDGSIEQRMLGQFHRAEDAGTLPVCPAGSLA